MESVNAYPLQWPAHYPRHESYYRKKNPFSYTFAAARDGLKKELSRLGAENIIISCNLMLKSNGDPYSPKTIKQVKHLEEPGIAVYFTRNQESYVLACDQYVDIAGNMQALHRTVEALRSIQRWGSSDLLKRAFSGFKALPEAGEIISPFSDCFDILGLPKDATKAEIIKAYKDKVKIYHPNGSAPDEDKLRELIDAYEAALLMNHYAQA